MCARYYLPTWGRFLSRDPLEFSASTNFYEYADNNPVDFSDPTGTQPTAGVPGGFGGLGGGGGGPGGIADYNNYGAGASSDMAIQSDSPTQPLGVHGVGVGLVLERQFSLGQSAGGPNLVSQAPITPAFGTVWTQSMFPKLQVGTRVFRAYGGGSGRLGSSWTTEDPRLMEDFRGELGLPPQNTATRLVSGTLKSTEGLTVRPASPIGPNPGGAPEVIIDDPESYIDIDLDVPLEIIP